MQTIPLSLMNIENSIDRKTQNNTNEYIPGQCNLGFEEIRRRKRKAFFGLVITLLSIVGLQLFHISSVYRFLLFIPLSYAIICYYQAQQKFCVVFGMKGIYNFGEIGKSTSITNPKYKNKDYHNARMIILTSLFLALLLVAIYFFLPI